MCILESGEKQEQGSAEVFCGSVKSFNSRRGFGFLSCEETATRFGRDVYLSKDEAMLLAAEPDIGQMPASTATDAPGTSDKEKTKVPLPVQEGDVLLFRVKLSHEGFPQAVQVKKMRRLRGIVQQAPSATSDGVIIVSGDDGNQDVSSDGTLDEMLLGAEVRLRHSECGQLTVAPDDELAFCCVSLSESGSHAWDAQLVDLISTSRPAGASLGCFSLRIPQLKAKSSQDNQMDQSAAVCAMVELEGRAVSNCIFLSKLPCDLGAPDLMRLFNQLGAKEAHVSGQRHDGVCYATISFDGPEGIAKFLVQSSHTVSEGGITQLAYVNACLHRGNDSMECHCESECSIQPTENVHLSTCFSTISNQHMPEQTMYTAHDISSEPICTGSINPEAHSRMPDVNLSFPPPNPLAQGHAFICAPPPVIPVIIPDWRCRCAHRNIVVPAMAPEMLVSCENRCSLLLQWPTVVHATSYVVELLNRNSMDTQRYLRAPPEGVLPCIMDLQVDNLQPGSYAACVRCIAPCGCESACSPWSSGVVGQVVPPQVVVHVAPAPPRAAAPVHLVLPGVAQHVCPPPPTAPPTLPLAGTMSAATMPVALPPIAEESFELGLDTGINGDEVLTLD
jgi:hypothetical protein